VGAEAKAAVAALPGKFDFVAVGKSGPDKPVRFSTVETVAYQSGWDPSIGSFFQTTDTQGKGESRVNYNIDSEANTNKTLKDIRLSPNAKLSKAAADLLRTECGPESVAEFGPSQRVALYLIKDGKGNYSMPGLDCVLTHTSGEAYRQAETLGTNISEVIADMYTSGLSAMIANYYLKNWFRAVGQGEILVK
jgi:hypothetical protein